MSCEHINFETLANVHRTKGPTGTEYSVSFQLRCASCGAFATFDLKTRPTSLLPGGMAITLPVSFQPEGGATTSTPPADLS